MTYRGDPYDDPEAAERRLAVRQAEAQWEKERAQAFQVALDEINRTYALVSLRGNSRILKETTDEDGAARTDFLRVDDFRLELANRKVKDADHKWAPLAEVWLRHAERRCYRGVVFAPGRDVPGIYNLWRGFPIEPCAGDCSLYKRFLLDTVCGGDARLAIWLWAWLAHIIQLPDQPIGVAVVLRGRQGIGKTLFGQLFGELIGPHYVLADMPAHVTGRFNAHLEQCLLLQVDDAIMTGREVLGRLKGLIAGRTQIIERKGVDVHEAKNFMRLLITSNERWIVPAGLDERRFAVFDVDDGAARDPSMFAALYEQMRNGGREALMDELLGCDLSDVDLRKPPMTRALADQKIESLKPEWRWWHECLCRGSQLRGGGWQQCVPRDALYQDYIETCDMVGLREQRGWQTGLGIALRQLYPDLLDGRPVMATARDRHGEPIKHRVRCYVFGPLAHARAAFETALGQPVEWPDTGDDAPSGA